MQIIDAANWQCLPEFRSNRIDAHIHCDSWHTVVGILRRSILLKPAQIIIVVSIDVDYSMTSVPREFDLVEQKSGSCIPWSAIRMGARKLFHPNALLHASAAGRGLQGSTIWTLHSHMDNAKQRTMAWFRRPLDRRYPVQECRASPLLVHGLGVAAQSFS